MLCRVLAFLHSFVLFGTIMVQKLQVKGLVRE